MSNCTTFEKFNDSSEHMGRHDRQYLIKAPSFRRFPIRQSLFFISALIRLAMAWGLLSLPFLLLTKPAFLFCTIDHVGVYSSSHRGFILCTLGGSCDRLVVLVLSLFFFFFNRCMMDVADAKV